MFLPPPRNLRDGFLERYDVETLVRSVRDGKPLPLAVDPAKLAERANEVEAIVAHLQRLPDVDWDLVERGEEMFVDKCELCHGRFGQPRAPFPPGVRAPRDLSDPALQRSMSDAELLAVVRHGKRGMPALPVPVSERNARALLAYVRLLSPGYVHYSRYCASCHGEDGRAEALVDPGFAPKVTFDRAYLGRQDPERLRAKVWHMLADRRPAMPHFRGRLGEAEVRAIIEYLKRGD
jgi:mono/diheme cytochrome c family protein